VVIAAALTVTVEATIAATRPDNTRADARIKVISIPPVDLVTKDTPSPVVTATPLAR